MSWRLGSETSWPSRRLPEFWTLPVYGIKPIPSPASCPYDTHCTCIQFSTADKSDVRGQQFITSDAKDKLSQAMGKPAPVSDYDVMGSIVFPSWEAVEAWFKDEENVKHQGEDRPEFADYSNLRFVTGEEYMIVEVGKPMI